MMLPLPEHRRRLAQTVNEKTSETTFRWKNKDEIPMDFILTLPVMPPQAAQTVIEKTRKN